MRFSTKDTRGVIAYLFSMRSFRARILVGASLALSTTIALWACSSSDCSEDATCAPPVNGADTSPGDGGPNSNADVAADGHAGDASSNDGALAEAGLQPAKLIFVNALTDLGPDTNVSGLDVASVRICLGVATVPNPVDVDFAPTQSHAFPADAGAGHAFPGVPLGHGGSFPTYGTDFETMTVRPYLMNAKTLAAKGVQGQDPSVPQCPKLLGQTGGLTPNVDYWQLKDIPAGTLKKNHTYVVAVTGCSTNGNTGVGACGPDDNNNKYTPPGQQGVGNLKLLVLEIDTTSTLASDEIGAQVINLSPQHADVKLAVGEFRPLLLNPAFLDGGNGATPSGRFPLTANAELPYNRNATAASPLAKVKGLLPTGYFALSPNNGSPDAVQPILLNNGSGGSSIQFLTTGVANTPPLYVNGKKFTFVLVGLPGGEATSRELRYLGFPNDQP